MTVIQCENVSISINSHVILSNLNFEIKENQFIGVFGPNGAGKTTFMKALLGIYPSQGVLRVFGKRVYDVRNQIGYVPQSRDMSSFQLTGRAFIASSIKGYKVGLPFLTKQDKYALDEVLEQVHAKELANVSLSEMSGGQRQRLLLAQALLNNPKLIILDEPFSNLDPKWVKIMVSLIKEIQQQYKVSILLSTHDLNPLLGVMDQVLCIGNQKAILGQVEEVITSPVLSDLYGFPLQVIRVDQHIFVTTSY